MLVDSIAYDAAITQNTTDIATNTADIATHTSLLAGLRPPNILVDGWCQITQGAAAGTFSGTPTYGKIDMWAAWASAGVASAGTIDQATAGGFGRALMVNGATIGAGGVISFRQRIEGARSCLFSQSPLSFSMVVRANTGTSFPARVILRTPTALDNFAATTVTYTGADQTVNGTDDISRPYQWENIPLASYTNGMEVEFQFDVGAITTKRFIINAIELTPGTKCPQGSATLTTAPYAYTPPYSFDQELAAVKRYFQKSFAYGTAPAQNVGTVVGALYYRCPIAGAVATAVQLPWSVQMRTSAPTVTFYNPNAANAKWRNNSLGADSGLAAVTFNGESNHLITNPQVAGDAIGNQMFVHWTADARF